MKRNAVVFLVLLTLACATRAPQYGIRPGPGGAIHGLVVTDDDMPIPGVTVTITAPGRPNRIAITNAEGRYSFMGVAPGRYMVSTELSGFNTTTMRVSVTQEEGATITTAMRVAGVTETITVVAEAPSFGRMAATPKVAAARVASYNAPATPEPPISTPASADFESHGFVDTKDERIATFSIDIDRASYANVRRYINHGLRPPPGAVRIEEMVNYFTYDYPQPRGDAPFSVTTEVAGCPWNPSNRLLRVGVQGRNLDEWRMAPNNLVFLIDVSGSMQPPDKLPLLKEAFRLLVDRLRAEDRIAIVVYAGAAGLVLPSVSGADKPAILSAIDSLAAGGSTAGGAGIELAYRIAEENFIEDGNNRVILATDGDFNVGVSSVPELEKLIEEKRASNIFLSVLGVGSDNFNDAAMETLADKGNGNYAFLDSIAEAQKVLRDELTGTLVTIAKDVKVQLEFDPAVVTSYRQIGYENRALKTKDFDDDAKDAGELGAGHSVTALFELVTTSASHGRIGTLRLRWKEPRGATSTPVEAALIDDGKGAYDASPDLQFAAAVAQFGMLLRNSPHKGSATMDDVLHLARVATGADLDGHREEFVRLAEKVKDHF